jgi:hypothetical protein
MFFFGNAKTPSLTKFGDDDEADVDLDRVKAETADWRFDSDVAS